MRFRKLVVACLPFVALANPGQSQELDPRMDRMLSCGAIYYAFADHADVIAAGTDAETMLMAGELLLNEVDMMMQEIGIGDDDRQRLGEERTLEMIDLIERDGDPGFSSDECGALLEEVLSLNEERAAILKQEDEAKAEPAAAPASKAKAAIATARTIKEADQLFSCAAAFGFAARGTEDADEAKTLEDIMATLAGKAEAVLGEDGWDAEAIYELGKEYGVKVGALLASGDEDFGYSWDECAALAF